MSTSGFGSGSSAALMALLWAIGCGGVSNAETCVLPAGMGGGNGGSGGGNETGGSGGGGGMSGSGGAGGSSPGADAAAGTGGHGDAGASDAVMTADGPPASGCPAQPTLTLAVHI